MKRNIAQVIGCLAVVLALSAVLGNSALAAGAPNSGSNYSTYTPQHYDLTPHGELAMSGTLACNILPSDVIMSSIVTEAAGKLLKKDAFDFSYHGALVQGGNARQFRCIGFPDQSNSLIVAANAQHGIHSGLVDVVLGGN